MRLGMALQGMENRGHSPASVRRSVFVTQRDTCGSDNTSMRQMFMTEYFKI